MSDRLDSNAGVILQLLKSLNPFSQDTGRRYAYFEMQEPPKGSTLVTNFQAAYDVTGRSIEGVLNVVRRMPLGENETLFIGTPGCREFQLGTEFNVVSSSGATLLTREEMKKSHMLGLWKYTK